MILRREKEGRKPYLPHKTDTSDQSELEYYGLWLMNTKRREVDKH